MRSQDSALQEQVVEVQMEEEEPVVELQVLPITEEPVVQVNPQVDQTHFQALLQVEVLVQAVARSSSSVSEITTLRSVTSFSLLATVISSDIFNLPGDVIRKTKVIPFGQ